MVVIPYYFLRFNFPISDSYLLVEKYCSKHFIDSTKSMVLVPELQVISFILSILYDFLTIIMFITTYSIII